MDTNLDDCPFCLRNNLLHGAIIQQTQDAYLVENSFHPGNYLIIPTAHLTDTHGLPDTWWADVKTLLDAIPNLSEDYNLSLNIGELAGQTQPHLHVWVIPRNAGSGIPGKGLLGLMEHIEKEQKQKGPY